MFYGDYSALVGSGLRQRPGPEPEPHPQPDAYAKGLFILNEGLFQLNNSTLSYYDYTMGEFTGDIFLDVNHRGLGDVGNDLQRYGSKLYIVVNNSNIVEVVDVNTVKSLKTINLPQKSRVMSPSWTAKLIYPAF